jgi:hypothetical protein
LSEYCFGLYIYLSGFAWLASSVVVRFTFNTDLAYPNGVDHNNEEERMSKEQKRCIEETLRTGDIVKNVKNGRPTLQSLIG